MTRERAFVFDCADDRLVGVFHSGAPASGTGVIIVVGGPQYRVGSHRQFVLMARSLAAAGIPVLRFDYRGMGDAEGAPRMFDATSRDIRAAIDCFAAMVPNVTKIVLLGLCDAASAILIYAHTDERVTGLILLNPWVRTAQGEAKAYLRHYYLARLLQWSFWRKVISGRYAIGRSLRELAETGRAARTETSSTEKPKGSFIRMMLAGLEQFQQPTLLVISERDLTAQEFMDLCRANRRWKSATGMPSVSTVHLPQTDHTMSSSSGLKMATDSCTSWLIRNFDTCPPA